MIGAFTVGKKALLFGYKRYGIPGAIASAGIALVGYEAVRRMLSGSADTDPLEELVGDELGSSDATDDSNPSN